jgi:hypothetical protein
VNGISQLFRKQKAEASLNPLHFPLALLQNMMAAFFLWSFGFAVT